MSDNTSAILPVTQETSFLDAALFWYKYGFQVIPIVPEEKKPPFKWDPWLEGLSKEKIREHWTKHPEHHLGFVVTDDFLVLDADSEEAVKALLELEKEYECAPYLQVTTKKGVHHYFRRTSESIAKTNSHSTEKHPDRIDVKTGRSIVVLPPSTGKEIKNFCEGTSETLREATQEFIDAVYKHNGKDISRMKEYSSSVTTSSPKIETSGEPRQRLIPKETTMERIRLFLEHLDPECGYDDWLKVLMIVFYESDGDEEGFEIANEWSSKGKSYKGAAEIQTKWQSFDLNNPTHYTFKTLMDMVDEAGSDALEILATLEPQFEIEEYLIINDLNAILSPEVLHTEETNNLQEGSPYEGDSGPLRQYPLKGQMDKIKENLVERIPVIGNVAFKGQSTVFFAAPNTGKTLITLKELINSIEEGRVNPLKTYYINVDDDAMGLYEKNLLAEEFGFNMIADEYNDFNTDDMGKILVEYAKKNIAKDVVIILDTAKNFVDLMQKTESTEFSNRIKKFVAKGGTLIMLAHTNKNLGPDGFPIPTGTSDIREQFTLAYVMAPKETKENRKTIEFRNIKKRGAGVSKAFYSYADGGSTPYLELIESVRVEDVLEEEQQETSSKDIPENDLANIIVDCIKEGITSKTDLVDTLRQRSSISKNKATQFINRYTGDDPEQHKWNYKVGERGKQTFFLLEQPEEEKGSA